MQQKRVSKTSIASDERYKAFIAQSTEGIWRFELEKPIPTSLPTREQIDLMYKYAYLAECNDAMAQMYGLKRAKNLIGARLGDLLIRSDEKNTEYLTNFIKSGYKLNDRESYETDAKGNLRIFRNNLVGIVENGYVLRAWGLQRDVTKQKQEEDRQLFLEKLSDRLVTSLDHHITLQEIARLIISHLADYCRIAIIDQDGTIQEIAVNHIDPAKVSMAEALYEAYKDLPQSDYGLPSLLKNGKPELMSVIDDALLKTYKTDRKTIKLVKRLELKSYMGVPLIARNTVIGAITFSSINPHRLYTKQDLAFAVEIARRIAMTLDNIRLYKEAYSELQERERIEENLRKEEERLRLAQEAGNIGIFETDIKTNTITLTPQLEKIYGLAPGSSTRSIEKHMHSIHPDDRALVIREYKRQHKTSANSEYEFRIVRPDKSVRWIYAKAQIFYDKKKKPVRMIGINIDVTERMQQQTNLRFLAEAGKVLGSSLNYETTLNQVAKLAVPKVADWFGIDMLDDKGNLQQIVVGHKDPKKIKWAKEIRKEYPPDMETKTGLAYVIRTGKAIFYPLITDEMLVASARDKKHLELIRKIGFTSAMIVPLFVEKKPIGAITFVASETKRQFTENDLSIAEELAHRASLAIENAKLYKSAQEAIMLRDDFISVASHELKTPITSVKIFTQALQKQAAMREDIKAGQSLAKMDKQIDKLTELIYNMLNIAKIQSGRLEFSEKTFDFDQMVREITEILQMTSKHKLVIVGKTGKQFTGDEDRIGQVLSNLISNAIKYSPNAEKVVITLSAKKNYIGVSVQDFGIGMGKQHLSKIFNRFYRVSGATDKTFPGLGIGLYISSEIIKRHGGKLWAESTPRKGSTFYMSLPLNQVEKSDLIQQSLKN